MSAHAVLVAIPDDDRLAPPQRVQQQKDYARLALRRCAELVGAPADGWQQGEGGAPLPNAGFFWSLSHKRRLAAAVIADERVGIDVEEITPRRDDLFDHIATASEWSLLPNRSWHSFFRLFTAKEAVLKAHGMGIGYLRECTIVRVLDDCHMLVRFGEDDLPVEHFAHAGHLAAVACPSQPISWHVHEPTSPRVI